MLLSLLLMPTAILGARPNNTVWDAIRETRFGIELGNKCGWHCTRELRDTSSEVTLFVPTDAAIKRLGLPITLSRRQLLDLHMWRSRVEVQSDLVSTNDTGFPLHRIIRKEQCRNGTVYFIESIMWSEVDVVPKAWAKKTNLERILAEIGKEHRLQTTATKWTVFAHVIQEEHNVISESSWRMHVVQGKHTSITSFANLSQPGTTPEYIFPTLHSGFEVQLQRHLKKTPSSDRDRWQLLVNGQHVVMGDIETAWGVVHVLGEPLKNYTATLNTTIVALPARPSSVEDSDHSESQIEISTSSSEEDADSQWSDYLVKNIMPSKATKKD